MLKRLSGLALLFCLGLPASAERDYQRIDRYALAAPASAEATLDSLAGYLERGAHSQDEKARAIFRWLTDRVGYDTVGFFSGHPAQDYGSALSTRKAVCAGYAGLYVELARRMGLRAVRVVGDSKGYGFDADSASAKNQKHAWVAVKIAGVWTLVDPTWGAGAMGRDGRFQKKFGDYWFHTPPSQMIYDHYPSDPQWQLLQSPWSLQQFRNAVRITHFFFDYGLEPVSHRQFAFTCPGQARLKFRGPENLLLTASLLAEDESSLAAVDHWVIVEHHGSFSSVQLRCPRPGVYKLRVYGNPWQGVSAPRQSFDWLAEYRVEATRGAAPAVGFPLTYGTYLEKQVQLYKPDRGNLAAHSPTDFRLTVPGAQEVKLIYSGGEQLLTREGSDIFRGACAAAPGKLGVFGLFPGDTHFFQLLEYQVR